MELCQGLVSFRKIFYPYSPIVIYRKILKLKEDHSSEVEELKRELEKERRRNKDIDLKAALSFGKSIDENQMLQLDELKAELKIVSIRAERYESENKQLQRDIDCACIALQEAKLEKSEQLFETESKLSAVSQKAHEQMKNMASKVEEWKAKAKDLEEELNNIQAKLQTSEERNAWYERENCLTDVIRRQKQLEVDVRRRDMDRKKLLLEIGRKDDKISLLVKTCEVLKTKIVSVEDDNLPIDDDELRAILKLDESSLHAQNKELAHQIDQLEGERNTLLKRLRNNAAVVYDDGRFLGLSSAQMQEVIEFAGNLKEGTQQLPLTDKSVQLNAELDELKAHRRSDLFTIDRLEKEIETLKLMRDSDDNTMTRELGTLRTSLEDIQSQNALLQEELIAISRYNKYQGSCAKCSLKEPDSINISQSSKDQLEKILGEILEATISASKLSDVIQQHQLMKENVEQCLSKNNELSAYASNKSNVGDIMKEKHGLEVELQNKSANLELAKCHITDLESQLNEKNRFFHEGELVSRVAVRKISKRSVYTQVESDRAETRRINVELQATRQALLISEDELLKAEKNMRRLQETVNQQSYDKKRILAAHKALRSILDEKKHLIAKYRQKETKKKPAYIPANSKRTIIKETARGEKDVQIATEISTLMESLEEMSKLVKEKDNTIKCLKTQILELQNELKDSISKHSKSCETLQQCRDAKGQLTKKVLLLEESLDDERTKRSLLTGDLEKEITAKNDKIESLTRSLQRVKSNLQSKSEELIESAAAQAELRRTKSALSAARRRSANGEKALSATLEKIANATEDNEKLHKEINCSRQQLAQLREDKMTSDKRLRIAREKLKEMRLCTNSSADKKEESKLESIEEDYKSLIFSLKNEITDLRGVVAASKLKKEADIKISATNPHAKGNRTSATLRGISSKTLSPANLSASKARLEGTNPSKSVQTQGEDNWICSARKMRELTEEIDRLTNTIDDKEKEIRTISNDKAILLERIFSLDESRNPKKSEVSYINVKTSCYYTWEGINPNLSQLSSRSSTNSNACLIDRRLKLNA